MSAGFVTRPDGSALPEAEAAVYARLAEGWPLNPKMLYCFCGASTRHLESTAAACAEPEPEPEPEREPEREPEP